jgi:hypothetical protein
VNTLRTISFAALYAALISFAGCGSPLVGLECEDGFTQCGSGCYDLANDPSNCGACGTACGAGLACVAMVCGPGGPTPDGGEDGGGDQDNDGAVRDGGPDASRNDGGGDGGEGSLGDGGAGADATVDGDGGPRRDAGDAGDGSIDVDIDANLGDGGTGEGGLDLDADVGDGSTVDSDGGDADLGDAGPPPDPVIPICDGTIAAADCTCGIDFPTECGDPAVCVNTQNDPNHCGGCVPGVPPS